MRIVIIFHHHDHNEDRHMRRHCQRCRWMREWIGALADLMHRQETLKYYTIHYKYTRNTQEIQKYQYTRYTQEIQQHSTVQRLHQPLISNQFHQIRLLWCAAAKIVPIKQFPPTLWQSGPTTKKRTSAAIFSPRLKITFNWPAHHHRHLAGVVRWKYIGWLGTNHPPPSPLPTRQPWALTPAWPQPPSCLFTGNHSPFWKQPASGTQPLLALLSRPFTFWEQPTPPYAAVKRWNRHCFDTFSCQLQQERFRLLFHLHLYFAVPCLSLSSCFCPPKIGGDDKLAWAEKSCYWIQRHPVQASIASSTCSDFVWPRCDFSVEVL